MEIRTSVKSKLNQNFSALNQRPCRKEPVLEFEDGCIERKEEQNVSTQSLQTQRNQRIDLQDHLNRHCKILPKVGFNSAKYFNMIKLSLLRLLVNERGIETIVITKANQFVSFKFGVAQLVVENLLRGGTSVDVFLNAYKASKKKGYFAYERWMIQRRSTLLNFFLTKPSFANCAKKSVRKDLSYFQIFIDGGLTSIEALSKLKLRQPTGTG